MKDFVYNGIGFWISTKKEDGNFDAGVNQNKKENCHCSAEFMVGFDIRCFQKFCYFEVIESNVTVASKNDHEWSCI